MQRTTIQSKHTKPLRRTSQLTGLIIMQLRVQSPVITEKKNHTL